MTGDLIPANVLATHTIANVSETLAEKLGLPQQYRSIGIITADSDDVTYCALDNFGRQGRGNQSGVRPLTPTRVRAAPTSPSCRRGHRPRAMPNI